jgi:hypothetical protein
VDLILDNLISEGKAKLMLILMDRGTAINPNRNTIPVTTAPAADSPDVGCLILVH